MVRGARVGLRPRSACRHPAGRGRTVTVARVTTSGIRADLAGVIANRGLDLLGPWLGPEQVKQDVLAVLYAGRHLLLEGPVGSGKTLMASLIARALPDIELADCDFGCRPGEPACPQCAAGAVGVRVVPGAERMVRV